MDGKGNADVAIIDVVIGRFLAIMLGAWVGLSTAFFAAFLWHWFKRFGSEKEELAYAECPHCDGMGIVRDALGDWIVCPLCDGEAELLAPRELDAG